MLRFKLALLALLACLAAAITSGGAAWAQGTVVAMGGAVKDDNLHVWNAVIQAAGGAGAQFVVISAASQNPARSGAEAVALLQRHGAQAQTLPVGPWLKGEALTQALQDPQWIERVRQARGVYFTGGDQSLIVQTLAPQGQRSPLLQALHDVLRDGGVIAGSSAGAAVMSELMFTAGDPLQVLKNQAGVVHGPGLGFVGAGVMLDQHFLKRGRIGRLLPMLVRQKIALGVGVDEDSAALIRGDELLSLGQRGVLVVDTRGATSDAAGDAASNASLDASSEANSKTSSRTTKGAEVGAFNVRGASLSFLAPGDRMNLRSGQFTAAAHKLAGRRLHDSNPDWRPYFRGEQLLTDLLGDFVIVNAMARLVDSRLPDVQGLSFDPQPAATDPRPELGFLWRLYRGTDTAAWSVGDDYSIAAVQLDVQPVQMARPLFKPWP